jgi:hypothetical protein
MGILEGSGVRIFEGSRSPKKHYLSTHSSPSLQSLEELETKKAQKSLADIEYASSSVSCVNGNNSITASICLARITAVVCDCICIIAIVVKRRQPSMHAVPNTQFGTSATWRIQTNQSCRQ